MCSAGGEGDFVITPEFVEVRLQEAGATLYALPMSGFSTGLRVSRAEIRREAMEAYDWEPAPIRPPTPSARHISEMDEALAWLGLIPQDRLLLRRIVAARSLVNPLTGRHVCSWRRLGKIFGADHKAVKRWHGDGIGLIVAALARQMRRDAA